MESLESVLESLPDTALSELQFCNSTDKISPFMSWQGYTDGIDYPVFLNKEMLVAVVNAAKVEKKTPKQMVDLARLELERRAAVADAELEAADTYVQWKSTPILNDYFLDFKGTHNTNLDYKWAFLFGEPHYAYERPRCQGALVAEWDAIPNRVPRGQVEQVIIANIISFSEEHKRDRSHTIFTFVGLCRLIDQRYLLLRHQENLGSTEFYVGNTSRELLHLLKSEELGGLSAIQLLALM